MKKATLEQSEKILNVFRNTPREQIQNILKSGFLADLRDGNIAEVNRDDFRKILGLSSFSVLEFIGTVSIPEITKFKFIAQDHFIMDTSKKAKVKISYLGDNFKENFLAKIEESVGKTELRYHKLRKGSVDGLILAELGGEDNAETMLSETFALMEMQPSGESGALLTNGWANIFYIRDVKGVLWAVGCCWSDDGWSVDADSVESPREWIGGNQVFSRNSLKT